MTYRHYALLSLWDNARKGGEIMAEQKQKMEARMAELQK